MKQSYISGGKFQWVSGLLLVVMTFLVFGKPILAADTMIDTSLMEMSQDMLSVVPESHILLDRDSDGILRSDAPMSGHTMICCIDGEERFSLASQTSLKLVKESGLLSQGAGALCEYIPRLLRESDFSSSGEITLLSSCQRE